MAIHLEAQTAREAARLRGQSEAEAEAAPPDPFIVR